MLGVEGLSVTYWTTPNLAIGITAGAGWLLDDHDSGEGDKDLSSTRVYFAGGIRYVLKSTKYANLSIGALADIGWTSNAISGEGASAEELGSETQWGLEVPLLAEFFFSDAFSVHLATGIVFTAGPAKGQVLDPARPTGLGVPNQVEHKGVGVGTGDIFGMAGFTFYL